MTLNIDSKYFNQINHFNLETTIMTNNWVLKVRWGGLDLVSASFLQSRMSWTVLFILILTYRARVLTQNWYLKSLAGKQAQSAQHVSWLWVWQSYWPDYWLRVRVRSLLSHQLHCRNLRRCQWDESKCENELEGSSSLFWTTVFHCTWCRLLGPTHFVLARFPTRFTSVQRVYKGFSHK